MNICITYTVCCAHVFLLKIIILVEDISHIPFRWEIYYRGLHLLRLSLITKRAFVILNSVTHLKTFLLPFSLLPNPSVSIWYSNLATLYLFAFFMCTLCMFVCIYVCMYSIQTVCMCLCINVCMYVQYPYCMYVLMYVCMYVCTVWDK